MGQKSPTIKDKLRFIKVSLKSIIGKHTIPNYWDNLEQKGQMHHTNWHHRMITHKRMKYTTYKNYHSLKLKTSQTGSYKTTRKKKNQGKALFHVFFLGCSKADRWILSHNKYQTTRPQQVKGKRLLQKKRNVGKPSISWRLAQPACNKPWQFGS